ncbi:MAG: glycosyltransferase [Gemmatimonadetes bacterium]|nr:glycosyltransferase [Gemmatimonadota bacterium]
MTASPPAPREPSALTAAVCTRSRPREPRRVLSSLVAQEPAVAEILVVDNAPGDGSTARLLRDEFPGVRYVAEPVPGLDNARNRGLAAATQPVVAFIDDDAVADRGWGAAVSRVFREHPAAGACTGRVEALTLEGGGQRLFEANGGYGRGVRRICLPREATRPLHGWPVPLIAWAVSVGNGCSLALRRDVALRLGGFDPRLDNGAELPGGGDLDVLWRVLTAGCEVVYEPRALAWHEHRHDREAAIDQIIGHQRALIAWLTKACVHTPGRKRFAVLLFLAWRLLKPGARLLRRATGHDPLPARALLRMWGNCARGLTGYRFGAAGIAAEPVSDVHAARQPEHA